MSWGCQKFNFREFSVSCSQTSSCARKPLVLRHRCIVYTSMWQVSSGLKEDEMGSQGPQCHGGVKKFHFRQFSVSCSQTSSCARKQLVLRHRCIVYTSMWQVSSGLKEDEMGSQGPQCHGVSKFHFREFSVSCSQTSSCARKPLVLRHRCIVYTSMWQVSSGLKEDEMGSQGPNVMGVSKNSIFDSFPSPAPKLALVPGSRQYFDIDVQYIQVCGRSHQD